MKSGLFVSHAGLRCGVYQFGRRVFKALTCGNDIRWQWLECDGADEARQTLAPEKPDIVVLNDHPATLGWASDVNWRSEGAVVFSIFHEAHQAAADKAAPDYYDFLLCPDPTLIPRNPIVVPVPRVTTEGEIGGVSPPPEIPTFGSFGFATPGKGFDRLCERVNAEFDRARIRLNIPQHDKETMIVPEYSDLVLASCKAAVTKPGIELIITHDFFDDRSLMEFLAGNSLNAFLYDEQSERGISSCIDYALASGRPLAITRASMSRHLHGVNPSICVEDCSLASIVARQGRELAPFRAAYHPQRAGPLWEAAILKAIEWRDISRSVPDERGFNKILDDRSRSAYAEALRLLQHHAPEMLTRKIDRANIQQAFALDTALRLLPAVPSARILAIGSFEDTAVATLKSMGYRIDEVDPNVNGADLETFYYSAERRDAYDLILCVSVLEHVADDELFMRMAADLLAPEGIAIFTVDFADAYRVGDPVPRADERFYTTQDISERLMPVLSDCAMLDVPSWSQGREDFEYENCKYGFAGWVFRKIDLDGKAPLQGNVTATPAWVRFVDEAHSQIHRLRSEEIEKLKELYTLAVSAQTETNTVLSVDKEAEYRRLFYDYRANEAPHELKLALKLARLMRKLSWKFNPSRKRKWLKKKSAAQLSAGQTSRSDALIAPAIPDYLDAALITLSMNGRTTRQ